MSKPQPIMPPSSATEQADNLLDQAAGAYKVASQAMRAWHKYLDNLPISTVAEVILSATVCSDNVYDLLALGIEVLSRREMGLAKNLGYTRPKNKINDPAFWVREFSDLSNEYLLAKTAPVNPDASDPRPMILWMARRNELIERIAMGGW